jgi:phosphorylcholine metabolism protein LicD
MQNKEIPIWERGQEGGHTRPINVERLFHNMVEVCRCLEKHGIRYWVSHGSMLGLYRDHSLIPWDDDADLGLDLRDRHKMPAVVEELAAKGYFIPPDGDRSIPISKDNMPWYDTVFIRDGEKVECWWFEHKQKDGEWFYIYDEPRCGNDLRHPAKYYDELQRMTFNGEELSVPNHIEDWMVMMYSHDWNKPQKNRKYNNQR